jgi:hypothetical protein
VFTGTLEPDDVATAMASSDLFVFPSRTDTAGNVVLEAQASGLPVLVSRWGGPRENMHPGESGFACDDLVDFARRAADLVRHSRKRQRFSDAARQYALTRRWETAMEPLYRSYTAHVPLDVAPSMGVQPTIAACSRKAKADGMEHAI